jgi:hypothetical protein
LRPCVGIGIQLRQPSIGVKVGFEVGEMHVIGRLAPATPDPDGVYRQIMDFYDKVGGFGHLSLVGRTGFLTHAESQNSIRLFAKEVLPRLQAIPPVSVG